MDHTSYIKVSCGHVPYLDTRVLTRQPAQKPDTGIPRPFSVGDGTAKGETAVELYSAVLTMIRRHIASPGLGRLVTILYT